MAATPDEPAPATEPPDNSAWAKPVVPAQPPEPASSAEPTELTQDVKLPEQAGEDQESGESSQPSDAPEMAELASPPQRVAFWRQERGAFLLVVGVLLLATVVLTIINRKGADDTPLDGGQSSQSTLPIDGAIWQAPPPCDGFSEQILAGLPQAGSTLDAADQAENSSTLTCSWLLPASDRLTVITHWFGDDSELAADAKASQLVEGTDGTEFPEPVVGDAARVRCTDASNDTPSECVVAVRDSNAVVEFRIAPVDPALQQNSSSYLIDLARDYAQTSLPR